MNVPLWRDESAEALDEASALLDDAAVPPAGQGARVRALAGPVFEVMVHGAPAPQGSKSAMRNESTGRIQLVESSRFVKPWREDVVAACLRARKRGWQPLTGPLAAEMVFTLTRPRSHFGTGRNRNLVRPSAPALPMGVPDLSKLARSTEDALTTAGVYRDDALLVEYRGLSKRYHTDHGRVPDVMDVSGCVIRLWALDEEAGR
ncbi:RusA family crossover junction endodeoxyribonuclease [Streptomyces sp. CA-253872]|uniref:RusA family crossover junction endodeoxyribonuclease n=1 Tax=Streptomyces sp. CA-253872 TaxID=3240067 RepID=UPI003D8F15F7